jgi:hypothetical protein
MSTGINIAPSSGLTVGTTAVTSGTNGRVFFQAGGVVQQSANLFWDNSNNRLGIGTSTPIDTIEIVGYSKQFVINGTTTTDRSAWIGNDVVGTGTIGLFNGTNSNTVFITGNGSSFLNGGNVVIGSTSPGARLDVRAQGALSTDIAFRVRNSADTADLISFRGDGSQWIQSVPFIHAGSLTGGTNTAQSLYIGYNSRGIASSGSRNVIIGTGAGSVISTNDSVCIGHNASAFNTSIAIGSGATASYNNFCVMGSESYPFSAMSIGTGGTVTSAAAVQNMTFSVGGVAGGYTSNTDLSSKFFRIQSQGGSGNGNGAPIQFSVAPSGASGFTANTFVIPFEVRGDAAGLNHYQLSTPRVPSASITDGYVQYSNDITAGNAAPHFRTENGSIIKLYQQSSAGIATVGDLVTVLQNLGLLS